LRNINKIDEFASHFNNVSLNYVEKIKGFDPKKISIEHMLSIGFSNSFIQTILSEEEEFNIQNTHVHNTGDLETLLSSNDLYKKKGKNLGERSAQSPIFTPKNVTSRSNTPSAHPVNKFVNNSSSGGGYMNPPSRKIEISHKLPVRKKRKTPLQDEENNLIENGIQSFSLEDIELEENIKNIFPTIEQREHVV
jgi:hypothetical protein